MKNLLRGCQELPDELHYLVATWEDSLLDVDEAGCNKGIMDLENGQWFSYKDDSAEINHYYGDWMIYLDHLRERYGNHIFLKRMLPDGTFEPWDIDDPGEF